MILLLGPTLVAAGWALSAPGARRLGPAVAVAIRDHAVAADCTAPWQAWAAVMRDEPVDLEPCAPKLLDDPWRASALEGRVAAGGVAAARLALMVATEADADTLFEHADAELLVDRNLFDHAPVDLGTLALSTPVHGLYDRGLLLAGEPADVLAALGPVADDLPATDAAALVRHPPPGRPGSGMEPVQPPQTAAPAPTGILALVPESQRDHVAAEWAATVAWVRVGGDGARWAAALQSRKGPVRATVHGVLRGDPVGAPLAAWVALQLAEAAGLHPEVSAAGADFVVTAGGRTVVIGRCGGRWEGRTAESVATVDISAADALAVVVSGLLRDGGLADAKELAEAGALAGPPAVLTALQLSAGTGVAPGTPMPPVVLRHPPKPRRRGRLPPPPPTPVPLEPPPDAEGRALAGWWAVKFEKIELGRAWAAKPSAGAAEAVRVAALAAAGEPGVHGNVPDASCEDARLPWP